jgi:hypothetical protein
VHYWKKSVCKPNEKKKDTIEKEKEKPTGF